jgi:hypothetical protein
MTAFLLAALLAAPVACPKPHRSAAPIRLFKILKPCPEKCQLFEKTPAGKYKLYSKCGKCQVDHVCPLACCGSDTVDNLQWLTAKENRKKSADCSACQHATRMEQESDALRKVLQRFHEGAHLAEQGGP